MSSLTEQIDALLALNAKGAVSHPVPGLAVELLARARSELALREAAAEADYERRILSALDSGTGGQEPVAWERVRQAYYILNSGKPPYSDRECKASMALSRALYPTEPKAVTDALSETMWGEVVFEGEDNSLLWQLDEAGNQVQLEKYDHATEQIEATP